MAISGFCYPMKLHHSQTEGVSFGLGFAFCYPMKLHHSQTEGVSFGLGFAFCYPMKLHHSQTGDKGGWVDWAFCYPMKLHHSQTDRSRPSHPDLVLLPYEITPFSNLKLRIKCHHNTVISWNSYSLQYNKFNIVNQ